MNRKLGSKSEAAKLIGALFSLGVGFYGTGHFLGWYSEEDYGLRMSNARCIANLKMLDSAKEQWAMDNHKKKGAPVSFNEIIGAQNYLKEMPKCPRGGHYELGAFGEDPICTFPGHQLPTHHD